MVVYCNQMNSPCHTLLQLLKEKTPKNINTKARLFGSGDYMLIKT